MNIFEITLDVDKRSNKESVNLRQGDINGTTIRATLRDHDVPMEGGNYTAMFCMTLPDRKTFYHDDATYENGVVSVVVQEQYAAAVPGSTNNAYFELYDGEELKYTTASFMVRVKPSAMDGEAAQSYDTRVETLMDEMRDLIDDETVAEEGRVAAESARAAAEQGRVNTFAANEAQRSETFTTNEGLRAAAFAEAEGARSVRFLDNEDDRQVQYEESMSAWTLAETSRADTFAANEAARQSTFEANEAERTEAFNAFASPTVAVEETPTGQVAHITWKDPSGTHVSDMVIDDAINVAMTGDTLSIPVDPSGECVESGIARFYFSGWVGDRMVPCSATITSTADPRFVVRITNSTAIEHGLIRIEYLEGTTYPTQLDVCTVSITCSGRTFLHRISAVAPRGGVAIDGADGRDGADGHDGADGLSPTVSIASTSSEHTVTITDVSGEHSYEVPTYASEESDRAAAESARAKAELARESAETQRDATVDAISDKIDALTTRGPSTDASYLYRVTNDGNEINGNVAVITSIRGNTLRWNQLAQLPFGNNQTLAGITFTRSGDGMTFTGTATAECYKQVYTANNNSLWTKVDHVYYVSKRGTGLDEVIVYNDNGGIWVKDQTSRIQTATASKRVYFHIPSGVTVDGYGVVNVIDLTQMFGAGNEPSTVAEFEALYPLPYYPYDAGTMLPVNMTGIATTGFNQWDEQWDIGDINPTTGAYGTGERFRSKNLIPVFPNTVYNAQFNRSADDMRMYFYDADRGFISESGWVRKGTFTTPANAHYMAFLMAVNYGTTYKGDICINLSDPTRNGTYEPYRQHQRSISAGVMRRVGTVYDELTAYERITRVGAVDLGTLDWASSSSASDHIWRASINALTPMPRIPSPTVVANANIIGYTCMGYGPITKNNNRCFAIGNASGENRRLVIIDTAYSTAQEFATAMSGHYMFYEVTSSAIVNTIFDPPLSLTYRVDKNGTERVMVPEGEQSAPPLMQMSYSPSIVDGLLTMPQDYISRASFAAFCEALEQATNLTITETWDDSVQAYAYEIVSGS